MVYRTPGLVLLQAGITPIFTTVISSLLIPLPQELFTSLIAMLLRVVVGFTDRQMAARHGRGCLRRSLRLPGPMLSMTRFQAIAGIGPGKRRERRRHPRP